MKTSELYFEDSFDDAVKICKAVSLFPDDQYALSQANLVIENMKRCLLDSEDNFDYVMHSSYRTLFSIGIWGLTNDLIARHWHSTVPMEEYIVGGLKELMISKQRDYGKGNIIKFGHIGIMVRVSDKIERLLNLMKNNRNPSNESVVDSYKDISNYALIGIMLLRGTFERELSNEK